MLSHVPFGHKICSYKGRIGDNFAVIGSIPGSPSSGSYTLRWDPARTDWPGYGEGGIMDSPAAYGLILVRILVKNNSTDLAHVHPLIDGCKLSNGRAHVNHGVKPLSLALFSNISASNLAYSILELTARTEKAVHPFNVPHPESVAAELAVTGVRDHSYHEVTDVNLTLAEDEATTAVERYSQSAFTTLNNGWITWKVQGL